MLRVVTSGQLDSPLRRCPDEALDVLPGSEQTQGLGASSLFRVMPGPSVEAVLKPLQEPVRAVVLPFRDTRVAAELANTVHTPAVKAFIGCFERCVRIGYRVDCLHACEYGVDFYRNPLHAQVLADKSVFDVHVSLDYV